MGTASMYGNQVMEAELDSDWMTIETIRIKTRPSVVVANEIDVLLVHHRLPEWSGMIPRVDPNGCLWEESSYVCNHPCSMAFPSLMFIEHNHMMHFDDGPIFVRNNGTHCIGKTTLVYPPSWFAMMFNKICFIWSKSIFFYLYHSFHLTGIHNLPAFLQAILFPFSQCIRHSPDLP